MCIYGVIIACELIGLGEYVSLSACVCVCVCVCLGVCVFVYLFFGSNCECVSGYVNWYIFVDDCVAVWVRNR